MTADDADVGGRLPDAAVAVDAGVDARDRRARREDDPLGRQPGLDLLIGRRLARP